MKYLNIDQNIGTEQRIVRVHKLGDEEPEIFKPTFDSHKLFTKSDGDKIFCSTLTLE